MKLLKRKDMLTKVIWHISGNVGGKWGDIHRLSIGEAIAKALVGEGLPSLFLTLIPCLRSGPKLDVAGSTPVARPTYWAFEI